MGEEKPDSGEIIFGKTVNPSYFPQESCRLRTRRKRGNRTNELTRVPTYRRKRRGYGRCPQP